MFSSLLFTVILFILPARTAIAIAIPAVHFPWKQVSSNDVQRLNHSDGWFDPRINDGRFLDFANHGYGEPLNVIISANSDPFVLTESGLRFYANSIGFSEECLGLHYGYVHLADLGDGEGEKPQQYLARQFYFPIWGTCWESIAGGNHFRAWKQNGTLANSGAWFLGVSKEKDSTHRHDIVPNGYNIGRDWLVRRATSGSSWEGYVWIANVEWRDDLIEAGYDGVNHHISQDGRIAILTVNRQVSANSRFPLNLLNYFAFPSHHVNVITALFANIVHIFLFSLYDR